MKKYILIMIMVLGLILQGCATSEDGRENTEAENVEETTKAPEATKLPEATKVPEPKDDTSDTAEVTQAATPEKDEEVKKAEETLAAAGLILPVLTNDTGKVLLQTVTKSTQYPYNSYIITSVNGESVVVDPTAMPAVELLDIKPAAIFQTHFHPDHTDAKFTMAYDVPKIICEKGEVKTKDFRVYTVLSSHSNDTIAETNMNVIVVFEVDGLRIAHMGDIGQTKLTEEQLKELGEIDIAFMQFENSYSSMTLDNAKGFTMIEQLKPKIVIPTHYTDKALPVLEEKYGAITDIDNLLEITKEELPDTSLNIYRILNKHKYK